MTQIQRIMERLDAQPSGRAGGIRVADGGLEAWLTVSDWDRLGCLLESLTLRRTTGAPLALQAHRVAETITYLGEPLHVIEAAQSEDRAVLRSAPPRVDQEEASFFEMVLDPSRGLSLARYAANRQSGERRRVSAALTRHAVARLLTDLMELASAA